MGGLFDPMVPVCRGMFKDLEHRIGFFRRTNRVRELFRDE